MLRSTAVLLACSALQPGLSTLLVADSDDLSESADFLASLLELVTQAEPRRVRLAGSPSESRLWGELAPVPDPLSRRLRVDWTPGVLTRALHSPALIEVPDLGSLGLAAARACVTLAASDVAHLERDAFSVTWQPSTWWLAHCAAQDIGRLSTHLLDRFVLRLPPARDDDLEADDEFIDAIHLTLRHAIGSEPGVLSDRALDLIHARAGGDRPRRAQTLARVALAFARLGIQSEDPSDCVETAAELLGFRAATPTAPPVDETAPRTRRTRARRETVETIGEDEDTAEDYAETAPVEMAEATSTVAASMAQAATAYLEDVVEPEREYASLTLPITALRRSTRAGRSIIGTEPARAYADLALVASLLRAAWFQKARRKSGVARDDEFKVMATDLRAYRRGPAPERMLCIVLDHTALDAGAAQPLLLETLLQGYRDRAPVVLVQVGAAGGDALRAHTIKARSVLVPRVWDAVGESGGRATPLAHGLRLAYEAILRATQHGRDAAQSVRLVVVTDGRGNVPLRMSRKGVADEAVGREGLDDAMAEARRLKTLKHVQATLLNPRPRQLADLPVALAAAMGATVEAVADA